MRVCQNLCLNKCFSAVITPQKDRAHSRVRREQAAMQTPTRHNTLVRGPRGFQGSIRMAPARKMMTIRTSSIKKDLRGVELEPFYWKLKNRTWTTQQPFVLAQGSLAGAQILMKNALFEVFKPRECQNRIRRKKLVLTAPRRALETFMVSRYDHFTTKPLDFDLKLCVFEGNPYPLLTCCYFLGFKGGNGGNDVISIGFRGVATDMNSEWKCCYFVGI